MKQFYLSIIALAAMLCVNLNTKAETYQAWGAVIFPYISTPMYDSDEVITIEDNTLTLVSATWGTGTFDLTTGEGSIEMDNHQGGTSSYSGTISGSVESGVFVITLPSVMRGTTITSTLGTMPVALNIIGKYEGGTYADAQYFKKYQPTPDQSITITVNEGYETVSISHTSTTWGTFTYDAATVTANEDGTYTISAEEGNCAMPSMRTGEPVDYVSTFSGTITDGVLVADLAVPAVMGGTTLKFNPADFEEVYIAAGIETNFAEESDADAPIYNLNGVRVDSSYQGIVIKAGKKYLQK